MMKYVRLFVVLCSCCLAIPAFAQKSPECKEVLDAMQKVYSTDHMTTTTTNGKTGEAITVGGKSYIQLHDKWMVSPISPQDMLKQEQENIKSAKVYTCKALAPAVEEGTPADVFQAHSETPGVGTADATMWISKATGLPLKSEEDFIPEGSDKLHSSTKYSYTNIKAPAVK